MITVDVKVGSDVSTSYRARALEGMFDVPRAARSELAWQAALPIDEKPWQIGLIVGPSGAGKSTIGRHLWPDQYAQPLEWAGQSVIDDFGEHLSMEQIAGICQAVGFNTIPAWLRPYSVLSTGEQFRVEIARRLAETDGLVVVDEFTSVVDRQVAQIGSHAIQKWVRKHPGRRFVAITCHQDVTDWLQPDWIYQPGINDFAWRSVQPRPTLEVTISPVDYSAWRLFAPFHYLTAELNRAARCWCLFVGDQPASFAGILHRPSKGRARVKGISRLVTLPDWQGMGLAFVLSDYVGSIYKAAGFKLNMYPAHPALIHAYDRSRMWALAQKPVSGSLNYRSTLKANSVRSRQIGGGKSGGWRQGSRPCAIFTYAGPAADKADAQRALAYWNKRDHG